MKIKEYFLALLMVIGIYIFLFMPISCKHEPEMVFFTDTICFEQEILPLLQSSCGMTGCHSQNGGETGFATIDYNSIIQFVEPGNAEKSKLYQVITDINSDEMMPPDQPLTQDQRMLIHIWIEQGALNNSCINTPPVVPPPPVNIDTNEVIDYGDSICFKQDILPMFISSCGVVECHDAITHEEGYILTDYAHIMSKKDGIRPHQPGESKLYKVLFEEEDDRMPPPPREPISAAQKEIFRQWIAEGAINSDCPDNTGSGNDTVSFAKDVWPVINFYCVGCHNANLSSGGVNLNSYQNVKTVAATMRNGTPLLLGVIKYQSGFKSMPPAVKLDNGPISKIENWINQGTQNN